MVPVLLELDRDDARGPAPHGPHVRLGETHGLALRGRDHEVRVTFREDGPDQDVVILQARADDPATLGAAVVHEGGLLDVAATRDRAQVLVRLELGHRDHGRDALLASAPVRLRVAHGDEVLDEPPLAVATQLGDLVDLQPMDRAPGGEDEEEVLVVRQDQALDEVPVLGVRAGDAAAAAPLGSVDVRRHPLDVAPVGQRNQHLALGDEGLVLDLHLLAGDLRPARVGVADPQVLQVFEDQLVDLAHVPQDLVVAGDGRLQVHLLLLQLLDLEAGETGQAHGQDRLRLTPAQLEGLRKTDPGLIRRAGRTDDADHLVDVRDRHQQPLDDMQALLGLALEEPGAPLDHLYPVVLERGQQLLQVEGARPLLVQRQQDHGERALQRRVAIQLVQDHVRLVPLLDLEDEAQAVPPVGLVVDVADALDDLVGDQRLHLVEDVVRVDLVGQLRDHDLLAVTTLGLDGRPGADDDDAATGGVRAVETLATEDDPAGREVRPLDDVHQVQHRDLRVLDQELERTAHLPQIVRRDGGGHPHGDALGAVADEVGEPGREDVGFPAGVVVVALLIDGLPVAVLHHVHGREGEAGLRVTHGRGGRAVDGSEVALLVHERVAGAEVLGQPHQGRVDHRLTVRVVVAGGVTGDLGALAELGPGAEIQVVHGYEDAPLGGLQTVSRVRQSALNDHAHGVGQVGTTHLLIEQMIADLIARRLRRRCRLCHVA